MISKLPIGDYYFKITGAKRKQSKFGANYASLGLVVANGALRGTSMACPVFPYQNGKETIKRMGLGVLGTMAETDREVEALRGQKFEANLTYGPPQQGGHPELALYRGVGTTQLNPVPGAAWNPPVGKYKAKVHDLVGINIDVEAIFEVAEGRYHGYRFAGRFQQNQTTSAGYLEPLGFSRINGSWTANLPQEVSVKSYGLRSDPATVAEVMKY